MNENRRPDYLDHMQQAATDARSFVDPQAQVGNAVGQVCSQLAEQADFFFIEGIRFSRSHGQRTDHRAIDAERKGGN